MNTIIFTSEQFAQLFTVLAVIKYKRLVLIQDKKTGKFVALFDSLIAFEWNDSEKIWEVQ